MSVSVHKFMCGGKFRPKYNCVTLDKGTTDHFYFLPYTCTYFIKFIPYRSPECYCNGVFYSNFQLFTASLHILFTLFFYFKFKKLLSSLGSKVTL